MPISLTSFLVPANSNTFPLLEDIYVKGGYRSVADTTARDAINTGTLKPGTLVYTQADGKTWIYTAASTWVEKVSSAVGVYASQANFPTASASNPGALAFDQTTHSLFVANGSAWVVIFSAGGLNIPYDVMMYAGGTLSAANAVIAGALIPRTLNLPANLTGSFARCSVAPTNAISFNILNQGTPVGTVNFSAAATVGSFTLASALVVGAGNMLEIQTGGTIDSTISNISICLVGTANAG